MSTKMTERDWELALEVFRACLSRRGAKGRDDRLFLEALHSFGNRPGSPHCLAMEELDSVRQG